MEVCYLLIKSQNLYNIVGFRMPKWLNKINSSFLGTKGVIRLDILMAYLPLLDHSHLPSSYPIWCLCINSGIFYSSSEPGLGIILFWEKKVMFSPGTFCVLESSHNTKILTNLGGHILSPSLYWKRGQKCPPRFVKSFCIVTSL